MIVVIQCAARKRNDAGFLRARNGKPVFFVAEPKLAPAREDCIYARPDDVSDQGGRWRDVLARYNENVGANPLGLLAASELYGNDMYRALATKFGMEKTFILSAGWGLIPASFLTPYYDITFSMSAEGWKRRRRTDAYDDLSLIPKDTEGDVLFFGGKDYLPLFTRLTSGIRSTRTVFYSSSTQPNAPGCRLVRFATTTRTNWHYECAEALLRGGLIP
jgi:hypothetical protein